MTPEVETHKEIHRTGHSWIDFSVAGAALLISLISLGVAIHHGRVMEQLVQANSLPFLQFYTSNGEPDATGAVQKVMSFNLENAGAGPARVETFSIALDDKPQRSWRELLQQLKDEDVRTRGVPSAPFAEQLRTSDAAPSFVRGGKVVMLLRWPRTDENATLWDFIDEARRNERVHMTACYCSIFDECWIADSKVLRPKPISSCETTSAADRAR